MNKSMNIDRLSGPALEKVFAEKLKQLLSAVEWLPNWRVEQLERTSDAGFDLLATVPLPGGGKAALCVECKRAVRPSVFRMTAEKSFSPQRRPKVVVPVLALPSISQRVAELCEEHGWSWFDLAGNHRLDVPGLLRLEHKGNQPVHELPLAKANVGTLEAARVIRALLLPEHAGKRWTQREIQGESRPKVSLGLVNKVVRYLRDEAFIELRADGGFKLRDPVKLLFAWRDAYRFDRNNRRGFFTLLQGKRLHDALVRSGTLSGGYVVYAAFSAAEIQAPHVRQPKTWLYVSPSVEDEFCAQLEAKTVDSGENLIVLTPADAGVFYRLDSAKNRLACTNVVQTYVDLYHAGGRGEEAAEALLEQRLKPYWRAQLLNV